MLDTRQTWLLTAMVSAGLLVLAGTPPASAAPLTAGPAATVPGIRTLYGLACPTATACVSVGLGGPDDNLGKSASVDAATGAATAWPGSLADDPLNAVACAAGASTCLTVADEAVASVKVSTAAMKVTAVPQIPSGAIVALNRIACASATRCYAVGFQGTSEASTQALVVALSGAGKIVKETIDTGTGNGVIACPTSARCLLSNANSGVTSIQVLTNGVIGAANPMPADTYVEALSCFQAKLCYALAGNTTSSPPMTNELFPISPTTGAPGAMVAIGGDFSGTSLACPSATSCVVAGFSGLGSTAKPATVLVKGGAPGTPVNHPGSGLSGIGCASATVCYAVGEKGGKAIVDKVSA